MSRISKGLDHLEESFIHKAVKFIIFGLPVKASCPPAENVNETPPNASFHNGTRKRINTQLS